MPQPEVRAEGAGNGTAVTFTGVTVTDGATYRLPDGEQVRAFVHGSPDHFLGTALVTLHTAEEWALDDLPRSTLDRRGRVLRQRGAVAPQEATAWTAADLAPGDAPAWDAAVRALGGEPWLAVDRLPAEG
jgi:hypothetical protein